MFHFDVYLVQVLVPGEWRSNFDRSLLLLVNLAKDRIVLALDLAGCLAERLNRLLYLCCLLERVYNVDCAFKVIRDDQIGEATNGYGLCFCLQALQQVLVGRDKAVQG